MAQEIIIVSGLPRSGTSLMMQMLDNGGVAVVTDHVRGADADNPKGYYELEQVKTIKRDVSWLPALRGKAVKMVSQLLYDLPASETYRIIFLERDLDEILLSQEKMLARLGRRGASRDSMKDAFGLHLERLHGWLLEQGNCCVLRVSYNDLLQRPRQQAQRVGEFLGGLPDSEKMALTVDPSLYRNRKSVSGPVAGEG
jgi:hypothetical protein